MQNYYITEVPISDTKNTALVRQLLEAEGIRLDANIDYTCALFDENGMITATGSCFENTLRCLAVSSSHQGEGLMNTVLSHLIRIQFTRGNSHLFLYTKYSSAAFFQNLGFYEITKVGHEMVFMENRRNGFFSYLQKLEKESAAQAVKKGVSDSLFPASDKISHIAAIVMNANPFTLGHQYLVEKASAENNLVHLFIVSEDSSLIPFTVRKKLVLEGTARLPNILYHETSSYMISSATFPSYFQKDGKNVIESQAELDLQVFAEIAQRLQITRRYVGEEPKSIVTSIYNRIMSQKLPSKGVSCIVVPRAEFNGHPISASDIRLALKNGTVEQLKHLVPETTLHYLISKEAEDVITKIRETKDVIHY